jgi:hypothetical protein
MHLHIVFGEKFNKRFRFAPILASLHNVRDDAGGDGATVHLQLAEDFEDFSSADLNEVIEFPRGIIISGGALFLLVPPVRSNGAFDHQLRAPRIDRNTHTDRGFAIFKQFCLLDEKQNIQFGVRQ